MDFTISGQVNRALFVIDRDLGTSANVNNNTASSTRVRVKGSSELMEGNSAGVHIEYEESGPGVNLRHANAWFSGAFGKVTLGQASKAGDGSVYPDPSGVTGIGVGQLWSSGAKLYGAYFHSLDAGGRTNLVRYDTPSIGPVSGAVSVANGDRVSAKIGASHEAGGASFSGTIATNMGSRNSGDVTAASLGVALASGITWSFTWSSLDTEMPGREKPSYVHSVAGYKFGDTSVAVSYYGGSDHTVDGSDSSAIDIGIAHNLPKAGVNLYAGIQHHNVEGGVPNGGDGTLDAMGDGNEVVATIGTKITF